MTAAGLAPEGSGDPAGSSVSIGTVLDTLRPEFPEITISKIRFLESEGLISPARTASGYRQFSSADVLRLRFVLSAQRDHYLPLKVIRAKLAEFDADPTPEGPTLGPAGPTVAAPRSSGDGSDGEPPAGPRGLVGRPERRDGSRDGAEPAVETSPGDVAGGRVDRRALLTEDGADAALVDGLVQHGLLHPDADGTFDPEAPAIVRTAATLSALGVEPRLLRGLRSGAEREAGLLGQLVTPVARHRGPEAAQRADDLTHELASLSGRLHALLVGVGLRQGLRR